MQPKDRADRAAAAVLRPQLDAIRQNFEGAIAGEDPEQLHDLRVAVRRTRTVLRQFAPVFPRKPLARFRDDFRWLQRATGEARDLDVYVLGFDELRDLLPVARRPALEPVLDVLHDRRADARAAMEDELRSPRCASLIEHYEEFLEKLRGASRARGDVPIGKLADRRIRKRYRAIVKMGAAIDASSPPEAYHELRKQGKELRYLLELFATPLRPRKVVRPMVKSLKSLQETLGRHQDREVQIAMLDSLRVAVAARPDGARAVDAIDELIACLCEDELAARDQFAERFEAFAGKPQRRLVKATF